MRIITPADASYFQDVVHSYSEGIRPSFLKFNAAKPAKCHENAELFFDRHPDHPIVRGWLVAEIGGAAGFFRLVAHSINRSPNGGFVDVTPLEEADRKAYCFIPHRGSEEEFASMRDRFVETYFPFIDAHVRTTAAQTAKFVDD